MDSEDFSERHQRTTWLLHHPSPLMGYRGQGEGKGKTQGSGYRQFNRTAKEANSNNSNIDKKNK